MNQKFICILVSMAFLIMVQIVVAPPPDPGPDPDGGGGRGGSSLNLDKFVNYLERWQKEDPDKFDLAKRLLHKEPWSNIKYIRPRVNINYNVTKLNITRNDQVKLKAYVENPNPEEIRRALYLHLEAKEPGDISFKPIGLRQIIQVNEYQSSAKTNISAIEFPEPTSFHYLKQVGEVELRINVSDGRNKYTSLNSASSPSKGYFSLLRLNVSNIPPQINNSTMWVTPNATWDGFVEYRASLNGTGSEFAILGSKKSTINATLHIYDENGTSEKTKLSKFFPEGEEIVFSTKDAAIFSESDAGKNFTYNISVSDGIIGGANTTWSVTGIGPRLKRTAKIIIAEPSGQDAEDGSNSWWHQYSFSVKVKAKDPDLESVQVTLYTDTPDNRGKFVLSPGNPLKLAVNTDNFTVFEFQNVKPFDVRDRDKNFSYYFTYDVEDMFGNRQTDPIDGGRISPKAIFYAFESISGLGNLLLILLVSLIFGVLMEILFFRRGGR